MLIYKDVITEDELFSENFKIKVSEDGMFYEVVGKRVTRKNDGIDGSLIGANASAEELEDGTEEGTITDVDIILNHNLQPSAFSKKSYQIYVKDYMKSIKSHLEEHNPERVADFMKGAMAAIKRITSDFDNFQFYTGTSMNPSGIAGALNYYEDGITPYMLFFKDGVVSEKF
ncbi:translationally-controlled tumor protein homolog [Takifugu rubripes]|uniref:Translationally-controlled tumor protein homolog n=1 Tax=Takifugu rubripes TaxID=31033 RepID=H2VA86_TAKRU|nr:translationally-controlled tumor protein [Takifugu rubripes]|eukprot:XP_003962088.1 PREDICTED: translationally-controlled tumor protein [Takifugu rubripes]